MGGVVNATPQPLYPLEKPGTDCIGGLVTKTIYIYIYPEGFFDVPLALDTNCMVLL